MSSIPAGPYAISRPQDQLLTLKDGHERAPINILSPTGRPGEQEWIVEPRPNRNVTIRNLKYDKYYLSYEEATLGAAVTANPEPREWQLRQSSQPFTFHVVVPGGPIDGPDGPVELVLDLSPLLIFPPLAALAPIRKGDVRQAWKFQFHE